MQVTPIEGLNELRARPELPRLREAAGKIVGSVFYGTLLKTMRSSALKGTIGHGGRGEEVFSAQLHGHLAERMGMSAQRGLADAIYKAFESQERAMSHPRNEDKDGRNTQ